MVKAPCESVEPPYDTEAYRSHSPTTDSEQQRGRPRDHREQCPPPDRQRDGRKSDVLREDVNGPRRTDLAAEGGGDRVRTQDERSRRCAAHLLTSL